MMRQLQDEDDRLRRPVIREGTNWRKADWEEANKSTAQVEKIVRLGP